MGNTNDTFDIDVTKCIGCRKGIALFMLKDGVCSHNDFFASAEAGAIYKCANSSIIENYLVKNGDRGTYLLTYKAQEFFHKQMMWWEDIITLAYDTLKDQTKVTEFFNGSEDGVKALNLSSIELENQLLSDAVANEIEVTEDKYPDLILWESKK